MEVLHAYSSIQFLDYSVALPLVTIFTCYGIAVGLGHVHVGISRGRGLTRRAAMAADDL